MRHVVWDWNGTLLNDFPIILKAANATLSQMDLAPISGDDYRDNYVRPVPRFYESLLGRSLSNEEFRVLDEGFYRAYRNAVAEAELTIDAHAAMDRLVAAGVSQSLLSMLKHPDLMQALDRHGLHGRFVHVDGLREAHGPRKALHLSEHVNAVSAHLDIEDSSNWIVIGDSIDDAHAAKENGLLCVLVDGGSHHKHDLAATGAKVAGSLLEALDMAGI